MTDRSKMKRVVLGAAVLVSMLLLLPYLGINLFGGSPPETRPRPAPTRNEATRRAPEPPPPEIHDVDENSDEDDDEAEEEELEVIEN